MERTNTPNQGILRVGGLTDNTRLYRYLGLSQFLSFTENKLTYITKIKQWEDTWEAPSSKLPTEQDNGKLEYPIYTLSDDMFGQCWSLNGESDALWRIYSQQKEGILIQTTVKKFELIKDVKYGLLAPVIYFDDLREALINLYKNESYPHLFADAFLKRRAFEHEREIRLITLNDERCLGVRFKNHTHIYINLDPVEFIESIIIDPRAEDRYVDTMQKYCKRAGYRIETIKSPLYSSKVFETTGLRKRWVPVKLSKKKGAKKKDKR